MAMRHISEITGAFLRPDLAEEKIRTELAGLSTEERKRLSEEKITLEGGPPELFVADELVHRMIVEGELDPSPAARGWYTEYLNTRAGLSSRLPGGKGRG